MIAFQDSVTESLINEIPSAKVCPTHQLKMSRINIFSLYFSSPHMCAHVQGCTDKKKKKEVYEQYVLYIVFIQSCGCARLLQKTGQEHSFCLKKHLLISKPYTSNAICSTKFTPMSKHFEEKKHYLVRAGKLKPRWAEAIFAPLQSRFKSQCKLVQQF